MEKERSGPTGARVAGAAEPAKKRVRWDSGRWLDTTIVETRARGMEKIEGHTREMLSMSHEKLVRLRYQMWHDEKGDWSSPGFVVVDTIMMVRHVLDDEPYDPNPFPYADEGENDDGQ